MQTLRNAQSEKAEREHAAAQAAANMLGGKGNGKQLTGVHLPQPSGCRFGP